MSLLIQSTPDIQVTADQPSAISDISVALLTGGFDRPYALGLALALAAQGVHVEVIGSDEIEGPEWHGSSNISFVNLWRESQSAGRSAAAKLKRVVLYYGRLLRYTAASRPAIFHILWNNKFQTFDRTLLMLYYRLCGKKICITAHNVNQAKRDGRDSLVNRLTLRVQYRLANHIFVHTQKMKDELSSDFGVRHDAITVIRHPINDVFPDTDLTPSQARCRLAIDDQEKVILFLGRITTYKGLEYLLEAFKLLASRDGRYRLVIAGEIKKGSGEAYLQKLRAIIERDGTGARILQRIEHIPDEDMELYLKAADVLVLPYKDIFQSGVLFLAYTFGLPVIATDIGSFREEIVEGKTGFICKPADPQDMAQVIENYFASDLYRYLDAARIELRQYARDNHSWEAVAQLTKSAYIAESGRNL